MKAAFYLRNKARRCTETVTFSRTAADLALV